ncbi:ABC transporter substrate-binding protein [Microbacterium sp.]|uniref:ABC transporter substrate-binding protein n=1 Tax=Microbacterium sp. TaxID=51671 RepID=UPI003A8A3725
MNRSNRVFGAVAAVSAAALILAGCSGSDDAGGAPTGGGEGLQKITVGTVGIISYGSILGGIEQGFFADEGLEVETTTIANPPAGMAAAQSGQLDVSYSPSIPLLNALSQGVEIQVVAAADGFPPNMEIEPGVTVVDDTGLYAAVGSDITEVTDLAGKTVSVPARNAQLEVTIAALLDDAGIDTTSGVNWVVLDFTSAVAALESGTVDAAGLVSPFTDEAEAAGAARIASPAIEFFGAGAIGLWVAGKQQIAADPDLYERFQRAANKASEWANEHPEEAIQAGLDFNESNLTVADMNVPFWPTEVTQEDLDRPNESLVQLGYLDAPAPTDGVIWTK